VAVHRRFAVVSLVTAGFALASIGTVLIRPGTSMPNWSQAVLGIVCVAAVLACGHLSSAASTSLERAGADLPAHKGR
jgi:hypothetical protein